MGCADGGGMAENLHDWYLTDWMATLRVRNADIERATGWDRRKVSFLVTGRQMFTRDTLDGIARALHLEPWELLLPPDRARRMRQLEADVDGVILRAAEAKRPYRDDSPPPLPIRRTGH